MDSIGFCIGIDSRVLGLDWPVTFASPLSFFSCYREKYNNDLKIINAETIIECRYFSTEAGVTQTFTEICHV